MNGKKLSIEEARTRLVQLKARLSNVAEQVDREFVGEKEKLGSKPEKTEYESQGQFMTRSNAYDKSLQGMTSRIESTKRDRAGRIWTERLEFVQEEYPTELGVKIGAYDPEKETFEIELTVADFDQEYKGLVNVNSEVAKQFKEDPLNNKGMGFISLAGWGKTALRGAIINWQGIEFPIQIYSIPVLLNEKKIDFKIESASFREPLVGLTGLDKNRTHITYFWDYSTGEVLGPYMNMLLSDSMQAFCYPQKVVIQRGGGNVVLNHFSEGEQRLINYVNVKEISAQCFSPDGTLFATGGGDGSVIIWNTSTGEAIAVGATYPRRQTKNIVSGRVESIEISPNNDFAVVVSEEPYTDRTINMSYTTNVVRVFRISDRMEIYKSFGQAARFAQNGDLLAVGTGNSLKIVDVKTWTTQRQIELKKSFLSESKISSLGFMDNCQTIVCGLTNGDVRLVRTDNGNEYASIEKQSEILGAGGGIRSVEPRKDGRLCAVVEEGGGCALFLIERPIAKETKKTGLPPKIDLEVKFKEPSGNNKLDANEQGEIELKITNSGAGTASGFELSSAMDMENEITFPPSVYIGTILPGKTVIAKIPLLASADILDGKAAITITPKEARGFAPLPIKITFDTKALVPPKLILADVGIEDPNKIGRIEPGEVVKITARIQNTGLGDAAGVRAKISIGGNVFLADGSQSEFDIGTLESGKYSDVNFSIYTNNLATSVPVSITVSELYGKYGIISQPLPLKFNTTIATIQEITVNGKDQKHGDIKVAQGLSVDVDTNIPETQSKNPDAVALVIGISRYKNSNVPSVDYAVHGATIMREYLIHTLGYSEKRIIYAEDENAGKNDFNIMLQRLANYVKPGKSDVFVYYNGHGAPDTKTNEAFFVPYDCDPEYADVSGFPVSDFYSQIAKLPARSITVVLDACFSGSTPKGLLLKGASPALLKVKNPIAAIQNGIVFSSSSENQLSNWYPEKKHGLFTYFFLKGLQGGADANGDKQITVGELEKYLNDNIPEIAREQNREQTPQVLGDTSMVLVKY